MGCSFMLGKRAGGMKVTEEPMGVGSERSRVIVSEFRPSRARMPVMEETGVETSRSKQRHHKQRYFFMSLVL